MALRDYTTADEVRAILGVSDDEIKDGVIYLPLYELLLKKELAEISSTCLSDYLVVDAKQESARTTEEVEFHEAFELFSAFATAKRLTTSLPLFSPKTIGDGKASTTRYSDSPYLQTIKAIEASYDELRIDLADKHAGYGGGASPGSVTPIALVGIMSPATDPVTEG